MLARRVLLGGSAGLVCWHCGKPGHRRQDCPTFTAHLQAQGKGRGAGTRLNDLGADDAGSLREGEENADEWCLSGDSQDVPPPPPALFSLSADYPTVQESARLSQSPATETSSRRRARLAGRACRPETGRGRGVQLTNRYAALATSEEESAEMECGSADGVLGSLSSGWRAAGVMRCTESHGQLPCCRGGVTRPASDVPPASAGGEGLPGPHGVPTCGQHYSRWERDGSMTCPESQEQKLDVLTVEGALHSEKAVFALDRPRSGWRVVTAVVDSGAEETVAPPGLLPGKVEVSAMQRAGGRYRAANGARIPNLGQQMTTFHTPDGHTCSLRFQIAGVERPLISVSQLAKTGHKVEFGAEGAAIVHLRTGKRIRLQRAGGVYLLRMRVRDEPAAAATPQNVPGFSRPRQ